MDHICARSTQGAAALHTGLLQNWQRRNGERCQSVLSELVLAKQISKMILNTFGCEHKPKRAQPLVDH